MKMKKLTIGAVLLLTATTVQAGWLGFAQQTSEAKQLTFAAYPGYAPDLTLSDGTKAPLGAGVALLYPVLTEYTFVGARVDWLGREFWAPSFNATVKKDVQLFEHNFTVFGMGGGIIPLGGNVENRELGAIVGTGIYTTIWRPSEKLSLQVFYAYEHWFSPLNTGVHRPGVALTYKW